MQFDFTPDPKVLLALTQNPMKPVDALCELIDNSIDSFRIARIKGIEISKPRIDVTLPTRGDIASGKGMIRVVDNGPGMSSEDAERSIKAGYSGNNPYDSLGLFGMGFNISTGKLGNRTTLMTALAGGGTYIRTSIDLNRINMSKNYMLEAEELPKGVDAPFPEDSHGTIIEVSDWWPKGFANHDYIKKLVDIGRPKLREEIGRRYASYLREGKIRITIDKEDCPPYRFCVWSDKRYVLHKGVQIPARFDFDELLSMTRRCSQCTAIVSDAATECPACGSKTFRTIEERVTGWVGIQRFDSTTDFGIDLIRNGRVIRKFEKDAFFTFTDDLGNTIKDYPIDGTFGRIVGEVHLDFVPVDFMKQDFNRTSVEWRDAISYLRGNSSLQPGQPGADENNSYIFKLFQGYRKVRGAGTKFMYMGYWDKESGKSKRISRSDEKELYRRFLNGEPGYVDDAEWWKLVEAADQPPAPAYTMCPECGGQNMQGAEECEICGSVLIGKDCIKCGRKIPLSATSCPHCGSSQIPKVVTPWTCQVCGTSNPYTMQKCAMCGSPKGAANPLSREYLLEHSRKDDDLSSDGLVVTFVDKSKSRPLSFSVYQTDGKMKNQLTEEYIPLTVFRTTTSTDIFVDKTHSMFSAYGVQVRIAVAEVIAQGLYDETRSTLSKYPSHNVSSLTWLILQTPWGDRMEMTQRSVRSRVSTLLDEVLSRLARSLGSAAAALDSEMTQDQRSAMTMNMLNAHIIENATLSELRNTGAYLMYVPHDFILTLLDVAPDGFFDGGVWSVSFNDATGLLDERALENLASAERERYRRCLETMVSFEKAPTSEPLTMRMANLSCDFIEKGLSS